MINGETSVVHEALRAAQEREEPVVLTPAQLPVSFFATILEVHPNSIIIRNPIPAYLLPYVVAAKSFSLFCRMYWLQCGQLTPQGTCLSLPISKNVTEGVSRQSERIAYGPKDDVYVEIQNPFDPSTQLRRKVYDLSSAGMSFRVKNPTAFTQPGRQLPQCRIYINGQLKHTHSGRIIYVKQIIDLESKNYCQVGVQFDNNSNSGSLS